MQAIEDLHYALARDMGLDGPALVGAHLQELGSCSPAFTCCAK